MNYVIVVLRCIIVVLSPCFLGLSFRSRDAYEALVSTVGRHRYTHRLCLSSTYRMKGVGDENLGNTSSKKREMEVDIFTYRKKKKTLRMKKRRSRN